MTEWWRQPQRIIQTNLRLIDADLDPARVARQAKEFGATALLFNVGGIFAWYPTDLPLQKRNPLLKGDLLGEMIRATAAVGLHFMGRFDLSKGTDIAYAAHPDWFCSNAKGEPVEYNGTYAACINGGWYQQQAVDLLEESLGRYPIDALFVNMFGYVRADYSHRNTGICRCVNCVNGFAAFSGGQALPTGTDVTDPVYRTYLRFQDATIADLSRKIYDTVKRVRPTAGIANLVGARDFARTEANHSVVRAQPEWAYQSGEQARSARSVGRGAPYSASIVHFFDFPWRFAAESAGCQGLRLAQQLANGGSPHYYFLGTFDQEDTKPLPVVRKFFAHHARYEGLYASLRSAARIGLYHSLKTERYGLRDLGRDVHRETSAAFRGAYRAMLESGLVFDTISDRRASDPGFRDTLAQYDVIVLPDVLCLHDFEAAALDAFVEDGGALICTGATGTANQIGEVRAANALRTYPFESTLTPMHDTRGAYFTIGKNELHFPDTRVMMLDETYWRGQPRAGCATLLRLLPPQRFGPPELCFPELGPTSDPGVVIGPSGRGHCIAVPWSPDALFYRHGLEEHRHLIAQLARRFSKSVVKLSTNSRLELTLQRDNKAGTLVAHVINYSGQNNNAYDAPVTYHGLRLGICDAVTEARALVAGQSLAMGAPDVDGYRWVELPPVDYMEAVAFS